METKKIFPLLIILVLAASTMLIAKSASASSNPSVPEFSVQYNDHSYDVPATYGTDPYTGQTIMTNGGYHVDNRTIDVTIKNQPFTPYPDPASGQTVNLFYNIRSKGHFEDWNNADGGRGGQSGLQASASSYTTVSFNVDNWNVPPGGQIDFEVQALLSYTNTTYSGSCFTGSQTILVGQSDWSDTQTITVGNPTPSSTLPPYATANPTFNPYYPAPTNSPLYPTATPSQPKTLTGVLFGNNWEQTVLVIMAVVIAVLVIALAIVLLRKATSK